MYIDSLFIWRLHSVKYIMHSTVITTTVSCLFLLSLYLFSLPFLVHLLCFLFSLPLLVPLLSFFPCFLFVSFAYHSHLWCCSFIKLLTSFTPRLLLLTDYFFLIFKCIIIGSSSSSHSIILTCSSLPSPGFYLFDSINRCYLFCLVSIFSEALILFLTCTV